MNFCCFLFNTILRNSKSDYNDLRTDYVLYSTSNMEAMPGDMAKNAYPIAIISIFVVYTTDVNVQK